MDVWTYDAASDAWTQLETTLPDNRQVPDGCRGHRAERLPLVSGSLKDEAQGQLPGYFGRSVEQDTPDR